MLLAGVPRDRSGCVRQNAGSVRAFDGRHGLSHPELRVPHNLHGSALVSRNGSVDWLCVPQFDSDAPQFDSDACMAALLGRDQHGCWLLYPGVAVRRIERRYRPGTLILETDFHCDGGSVRLTDFMPIQKGTNSLVRVIEGLDGSVPVDLSLRVRFGFGSYRPLITKADDAVDFVVAPDALTLRTPAPLDVDQHDPRATLRVDEGNVIPFELNWHASAGA
jgi:GH15 family glucan-1,4-alpha-glucosidase